MKKKKINADEKIPVKLSLHERDLIRKCTGYDPDFARDAVVKGKAVQVHLSLDELDDLIGYTAAEANHSDNQKLQRELDDLCDKLEKILDSYEDEE